MWKVEIQQCVSPVLAVLFFQEYVVIVVIGVIGVIGVIDVFKLLPIVEQTCKYTMFHKAEEKNCEAIDNKPWPYCWLFPNITVHTQMIKWAGMRNQCVNKNRICLIKMYTQLLQVYKRGGY